jgi:hypothetical protein
MGYHDLIGSSRGAGARANKDRHRKILDAKVNWRKSRYSKGAGGGGFSRGGGWE